MWCFSDPQDPAPAAPGAGAPPSTPAPTGANGGALALPPGGGGGGGGSGPAPPAATPPAAAGPGAVAPCPCASAEVTSEMVMAEPPDRARTRMAVGERVRVTYSLGAAEWTQAGDGDLSSTSGATVTLTAPSRGGSVTLTATGCGCSAAITFTIVEPSAVHMVKKFTSAARVEHTLSMPDVGMFTNIFFAPADVNFHRVQWIELEIVCTASGVHACNNNSGHFPNAAALSMTTHVQAGVGTYADAFDHVYSGHCGVAWAAPQTGAMHWPIPWRWRVGGAGAFRALATAHQRINVDAAGLCTATKAGAHVSVLATAATSAP